MTTLFFDLASHHPSAALVTDGAVAAYVVGEGRIGDADVLPFLKQVVGDWSTMDRIACVIGPGGFTSLRVAVTCANALADQLEVPLAGIHLAEVYEARLTESAPVIWLHSTKKHALFIRGFGSLAEKWPEAEMMEVDALVETCESHVSTAQWVGELIPEHQDIVTKLGATEAPLKPLKDVLPDLLEGLTYESQILTPWYGRGY